MHTAPSKPPQAAMPSEPPRPATEELPVTPPLAGAPPDAHDPQKSCDARVAQLEREMSTQEDRLAGMLRIAQNLVSTSEPQKAMRSMVSEISALLNADRCTIYIIERESHRSPKAKLGGDQKMLSGITVQGKGHVTIGIPVGVGIAGTVAAEGRALNIKEARQYPSFDPKYDKLTGYYTRSTLCVPMRNPRQEVIGVVQVLNKIGRDYFSREDEQLLTALANQAAITLDALKLQLELKCTTADREDAIRSRQQRVKELEALVHNERAIADAQTPQDLCDVALQIACQIADYEYAAAFLHDEGGAGPIYLRGPTQADQLQILPYGEVGEGLLGKVASHTAPLTVCVEEERLALGEAAFLRPVYQREHTTKEIFALRLPAQLAGPESPTVHDAVVAPLIDGGRRLGAVALVNRYGISKRELEDKDEERDDERFVHLIASQIARGLTRQVERREAQQRTRLMTIGSMLSGVLHDLKGPMSIISGYAQLMVNEADREEREQMAETILRKVGEFNNMTREVMNYVVGKSTILVRKVYLQRFIEAVQEQIAFEFEERGVRFVVRDESLGFAFFDEGKMLRVVTNIARNARQAMGNQGTFTWTLQSLDAVEGHSAGLRFTLQDDGPGIPEAIQVRLFEAFATEGQHGGTGLGLAIVKRIIDDHGGQIRVQTAPQQGTTFTIDLPGRPNA